MTSDTTLPHGRIVLVANRASGTNARDADAIDRARRVLGECGLSYWTPRDERMEDLVEREIARGAGILIAAGGDGTAMALANAMLGRDAAMAALPLGTFNFYARGLGLGEDPEAAARGILGGTTRAIRVGTVNGRVFLNNASLGIYPAILRERESIYRRWGRHQAAAHWSVAKTFLRFQRPMHMRLKVDGAERNLHTPLLFIARSAYQLEYFNLAGAEAIHDDRLAVLVGRGDTRAALFTLAGRLAAGLAREGRDYELITARDLKVETRRPRPLVAFDGEKSRERVPFNFTMSDKRLRIVLPGKEAA